MMEFVLECRNASSVHRVLGTLYPAHLLNVERLFRRNTINGIARSALTNIFTPYRVGSGICPGDISN